MKDLPELPAIAPNRRVKADEAMLYKVAKANSDHYRDRNPAGLIGGTAVKIVFGLSRPTTDLDFVRSHAQRNRRARPADSIPRNQGDQRHPGPERAATRIEYKAGWLRQRQLKVDETSPRTGQFAATVKHRGITTYREGDLVRIKLQAVLPKRSRIARAQARDLYDCAWIARNRPGALDSEHLHALRAIAEQNAQDERMRRWREDFQNDPIMRRIPITIVLKVLRAAVATEMAHRERLRRRQGEANTAASAASQPNTAAKEHAIPGSASAAAERALETHRTPTPEAKTGGAIGRPEPPARAARRRKDRERERTATPDTLCLAHQPCWSRDEPGRTPSVLPHKSV